MTSFRPWSSPSGLSDVLVFDSDIFAYVHTFAVAVGFFIEVFDKQENREQKHLGRTLPCVG
jgi:hypothetical protein